MPEITSSNGESLRNQSLPPGVSPEIVKQTTQAAAPAVTEQYAGFWVRYAASIMDGLIIGIPLNFIYSLIYKAAPQLSVIGGLSAIYQRIALSLFVGWIINIIFLTAYGATPGKMFFKIRVIEEHSQKVSFGTAAVREVIGKIFGAVIIYVGFLMAAFDSKKQGLHDKLAKTYVVFDEPLEGFRQFLVYAIIFLGVVLPVLWLIVVFAFFGSFFGSFAGSFIGAYKNSPNKPFYQQSPNPKNYSTPESSNSAPYYQAR